MSDTGCLWDHWYGKVYGVCCFAFIALFGSLGVYMYVRFQEQEAREREPAARQKRYEREDRMREFLEKRKAARLAAEGKAQ